MDYLIDWNCHLLPGMRERVSDPRETIETMRLLYDRFSFTHFCMMPDYDCTREPLSVFLLRFSRAKELLSPINEQYFRIRCLPRAILAPSLHQTENLERLATRRGNYLPVRMPISEYEDWIDFELNRLLYRRKMKLWFTSFEQCVLLYPPSVIEKLCSIPNTVYQFGFKSLSNPKVTRLIVNLARSNRVVLFGSMVDCLERAYQFDYAYYEKTASELLSVAVYQTILRQNHYFWTKQMR